MSQELETPEDGFDHLPQLEELAARIESLVAEHQRVRASRDELEISLKEQSSEIEELKARITSLLRGRDAARKRLDGVIGHLTKIEGANIENRT